MAAGVVDVASNHSVDQTVARLKGILEDRAMTLFAEIDHSGEAAKAGMTLPPTRLLVFGNPRAGTPLMQAAPTTGIDLPLKILVWQDSDGRPWISYNSPEYLQDRHGFPPELMHNIAGVAGLASAAAA